MKLKPGDDRYESISLFQISNIATQQIKLLGLFEDVQKLQKLLREKDEVISDLEIKIDQLEQYTRIEDVIITNVKTTHCSYSSAVREDRDAEAPPTELESLEHQVLKFLAEKNIDVQSSTVAVCHMLPNKGRNSKPAAIIMRFANRKHKTELMKQSWKLKESGVYLNYHLTKRNVDIVRHPRILKKKKRIQGTLTQDSRVMIQLNRASPEETSLHERSRTWPSTDGIFDLLYKVIFTPFSLRNFRKLKLLTQFKNVKNYHVLVGYRYDTSKKYYTW